LGLADQNVLKFVAWGSVGAMRMTVGAQGAGVLKGDTVGPTKLLGCSLEGLGLGLGTTMQPALGLYVHQLMMVQVRSILKQRRALR
jgi:hypothetical protein